MQDNIKTDRVLTTPDDMTRHDEYNTNRNAWITPAVATN